MHCNDPRTLAAVMTGAAFAGCAWALAVVTLPGAIARRFAASEERRRITLIGQTVAASAAAVFFGVLSILAVVFLAGGLHLCR